LDILLLTTKECLSNFRNHNPLFLDIACEGIVLLDEDDFLKSLIEETRAYISERKLRKLEDGWEFPVTDRVPVYLSNVSNKDFAIAMLTDGERDFEIAVKILEGGYFDKAVYHFQQSVEKAVKAILICFGIFKKTHFVGEILLKELERRELDDNWKEKLVQIARLSSEIEPEVTWSRYPRIDEGILWLPYEEYTEDDANEIKEKCKQAVKAAREFFEWWFR
jgi:HEPN domain-containing protein